MWIEYGRPSWQQSSSVARGADSTWAWMLPGRAHTSNFARREPYFSPKFSHISPPTDLICVIFIWIVYVNKGYHCNKNGAKRHSIWSDTQYSIFAHFPLRKSTKGVPKRWKTNLHQIYSLKPRMVWYYKGSVAILFWDEKRLWLKSGGLKCENSWADQCQNLNGNPTETIGVVRLTPNFVDYLVMFIKHGLHQNSHISGHLLRRPPLGHCLWNIVAGLINAAYHTCRILHVLSKAPAAQGWHV